MVINREFFFRGWLPAGLVINARLLSSAPSRTNQAVMVPIICPVPGSGWEIDQPSPTFPIEQATADTATVLVDPIPNGTLAVLPLKEWFGDGTPYILGVNTWYEGRIRVVTGSDVMAIRIIAAGSPKLYSAYSGLDAKDVSVVMMPCHHIVGTNTKQVLAADSGGVAMEELSYPPMITAGSESVPARVLDVLETTTASFAGMQTGFLELNPGTGINYIQCRITDGKYLGQVPNFIGIVANPKLGRQKFYNFRVGEIAKVADEVSKVSSTEHNYGTIAYGAGGDQVVHYN